MLDNLEKECNKAYNSALANGIPAPETLLKHLKDFVNQVDETKTDANTLFGLIDRFINNEIKHKGKRKTDNTIKSYRTANKSLVEFQTVWMMMVQLSLL